MASRKCFWDPSITSCYFGFTSVLGENIFGNYFLLGDIEVLVAELALPLHGINV